jgi:hypothetical protein
MHQPEISQRYLELFQSLVSGNEVSGGSLLSFLLDFSHSSRLTERLLARRRMKTDEEKFPKGKGLAVTVACRISKRQLPIQTLENSVPAGT